MRIVGASFAAADPEGLASWYAETLGVSPPSFVLEEATPHHFAFHVPDLAPWKKRLAVAEEYDFSDWGGARAVYFRDPEQNVVELIARPQARPELSLAEVGLPVEDVGAAVDVLEREFGLALYDGGRETFAAVGDDDGLLIVVSTGRAWFPDDVPAGTARVEVTVAGARSGELTLPGSRHRVVSI